MAFVHAVLEAVHAKHAGGIDCTVPEMMNIKQKSEIMKLLAQAQLCYSHFVSH